MAGFWISLLVVTTVGMVAGLRTKQESITCDLETILRTEGTVRFDRDVFVVAHGRYSEAQVPKEIMRRFADPLNIDFGRSGGDGPFTASDLWEQDSITEQEMETAGRRAMLTKYFCKDCGFTRTQIKPLRIVSDTALRMRTVINRFSRDDDYYAANYFNYYFDDSRGYYRPLIYECFNEPLGKWRALRPGDQTEREMIIRLTRRCNRLCTTVKLFHPDMKVGGPAAAFTRPYFHRFDYFREKMKVWLDNINDCQDFISEHLYDVGGGILEGNIDLLETYMKIQKGKIYKYVASEFGSFNRIWYDKENRKAMPGTDGQEFQIMAEAMKVLHGLLRTPDNIDKAVTFMTADGGFRVDPGDPKYPWSLTVARSEANFRMTNLVRYYRLLQGVSGRFTYSTSSHPDIYVHSFVSRNKSWMLIQNLRDSPVDLQFKFPGTISRRLERVSRKRLYLVDAPLTARDKALNLERGGRMVYENTIISRESGNRPAQLPSNLTIGHDEMVTYEFTFNENVNARREINRTRHYSDKVLVDIRSGVDHVFMFNGLPTGRGVGTIRVAHSRGWSRSDDPEVKVNGVPVQYHPDFAGGKRDHNKFAWFGAFSATVSLERLGRNPKVTIRYPPGSGGGTISSVTIQVDNCEGAACCALDGIDGVTGEEPELCDSPFAYPIGAPAPPPTVDWYEIGPPLLQNRGFESDSAWDFAGGARISELYRRRGTAGLYLPVGGMVQQVVRLRESFTYRLSCATVGLLVRFLVFRDRTPVPVARGYERAYYMGEADFGEKQMRFSVPEDGNYIVRLLADNGRAVVDNCRLYRVIPRRPNGEPAATPRPQPPAGWNSRGDNYF
ncbi:hypothetical protein NDN08_000651 [Rhodosorus marinus]|uniref:Beta-porphyranase A C-terminal domain-containing protein n=1 Tax=Rhodosorus marinus TaxID=101924 RepID=A0AAV8UNS2_9RHOD|nr:hypothetical protein NDN08_000651 [Rhodosorus marinus]